VADLLARGMAFLAGRMKNHASSTVTYIRGELSVAVEATHGRTEFGLSEEQPVWQSWQSRDFIIDRADMLFDGVPFTPMRGDVIEESDGVGSVYRYEVMAPPGSDVWRFSDSYKNRIRVHTKQIGITGGE
jgi:hypothetical protein